MQYIWTFFLLSRGLALYFYANIWKRIRMNVANQHSHQSCFTSRFLVVTQKERNWILFHFQILREHILYSDLLLPWWIMSEYGLLENVSNAKFFHVSVSGRRWGCMYMWVFTSATRKWLFVSSSTLFDEFRSNIKNPVGFLDLTI